MESRSGGMAEATNVARVRRNLRFVKDHIQHRKPPAFPLAQRQIFAALGKLSSNGIDVDTSTVLVEADIALHQ